MKKYSQQGFTVLELLIVLGIMTILIGLILVGLTRARSHSRDEQRVANLQTIALALQQYHDVCKEYPHNLKAVETCDALSPANLGSFIANINDYPVSTNGLNSEYDYLPLAYDGDYPNVCTGYHLFTRLESDKAAAAKGAKFDATGAGIFACANDSGNQINALVDPLIYDIRK